MHNKISACIITCNGAATIQECLESTSLHVQEIIVVIDTKTTDNTEEICRHYTDKVYHREWNGSYADARNFAISKASGDKIFTIDDDEKVIEFPEITEVNYYWFTGINPAPDGFNTESKSIRLFDNIGIKYDFATHEQLFYNGVNIAKSDLKGKLDGVIAHKAKNLDDVKEKTKSLLETALRQRSTEPNNVFLRGQIGGYYKLLGDNTKAVAHLFLCILLDDVSPNSKAGAALQLFKIYEELGEIELAHDCLVLSLRLCPQQLSAYAVLHEIHFNNGDEEKAKYYKEVINKIGNTSLLPFDMDYKSIKFYN